MNNYEICELDNEYLVFIDGQMLSVRSEKDLLTLINGKQKGNK